MPIRIDNFGGLVVGSSPVIGGISGSVLYIDSFGNLAQRNPGFTYDGATLKLRALGSANIREFQDASGNVLGGVTSTGVQYVGAAPSGYASYPAFEAVGNNAQIFVSGINSPSISAYSETSTVQVILWALASGVNEGYVGTASSHNFGIYAASNKIITVTPAGLVTVDGSLRVNAGSAATVGEIVRGFTAQSADLQQWQNFSGTPLVYIDATGFTTFTQGGVFKNTAFFTNSAVVNLGVGSAVIGRDITSTDHSLISFSGTTGTIGSDLNWYWPVRTNGFMQIVDHSYNPIIFTDEASRKVGINDSGLTAQLVVSPLNASTKGFIVKGFASQTANLTEWQNSSSAVLAVVDASGQVGIGRSPLSALDIYASSPELRTASSTANQYVTHSFYDGSTLKGQLLYAGANPATLQYFGFINFASDYMTFLNVAAVPLYFGTDATSRMIIDGLGRGGFGVLAPNGHWEVQNGAAARVASVVRGAVSQSANLQEWQNSSTAVLSSVTSDGRIAYGTPFANTGIGSAASTGIDLAADSYAFIATNTASVSQTGFGIVYGGRNAAVISAASGTQYQVIAVINQASKQNSGALSYLIGTEGLAANSGTGAIGAMWGLDLLVQSTGAATITDAIGLSLRHGISAGTMTSYKGINIASQSISGSGVVTSAYGIYIDSISGAGTNYAIYTNSGPLYFGDVATFVGDVTVPDEAYGSSWNGSLEVPTKNAIYDKIQTIASDVLFDHFADANNGTTVETDLYSDTLVASQLSNNGEKIVAQYGGTFVGDATSTQRLKTYFGGTLIFDSGALGIGASTSYWNMTLTCVRESSSIVRCTVALNTSFATLNAYATYTKVTGLTLSNTQIIKITGTAAGVTGASNQITASEAYVEFKPAA